MATIAAQSQTRAVHTNNARKAADDISKRNAGRDAGLQDEAKRMRLEAAQRERAAFAREQERLKEQAGQQPNKAAPEQRPEEKRHRDLAWLTEKFPTMAASEIENVLDEHGGRVDLAVEALRKSEKAKEMQQQTMATPEQEKKPEKKSSGVCALL